MQTLFGTVVLVNIPPCHTCFRQGNCRKLYNRNSSIAMTQICPTGVSNQCPLQFATSKKIQTLNPGNRIRLHSLCRCVNDTPIKTQGLLNGLLPLISKATSKPQISVKHYLNLFIVHRSHYFRK